MPEIQSIYENSYISALPPWAQEERETEAILSDPQLKNYLECVGGAITGVEKGTDGYKIFVVTPDGPLEIGVRVTHERQSELLGPVLFTWEFAFPDM